VRLFHSEVKVDKAKEVIPPVISTAAYKIRAVEKNWDYVVGLPEGMSASDFKVGQVMSTLFSAARAGIDRLDEMTLVGADDSFVVKCIVTEPQALGCKALVLGIIALPPREELAGAALPDHIRVRQAGGDVGLCVERKNKDGSWHQVASEKNFPSWSGRPDRARDHAREYARTISDTPGRV
jgi:hypothetical protein